jgi:hypothetical protein
MNPFDTKTVLHPSFDEANCNNKKVFTFTLPLVGEVKCDFYHFGKLAFHFGLHGAVSSTGYKSNFLHREQLVGFENPQEVAEILAKELYEAEGKLYQKQLRVQVLENTQLRLW